MLKARIIKRSHGKQTIFQIQQRHFIFFWWWVPAWVNDINGAAAPQDTFKTLKEAQDNMCHFDGSKPVETICIS